MGRGWRDRGGFWILYDRYVPTVYRYLDSKLKNPSAAEAATAEVFFEVLRDWHGNLTSERDFSSRLYELAVNAARAHSTDRWKQVPGQPLTHAMPRSRTDTRPTFRNFHGIEVVRWTPRWQVVVLLAALSLVLFILGLLLFGKAVAITHGGSSIKVGPLQATLVAALMAGLGVAHEAIHALVLRGFGARPRFGVALLGPFPAMFYVATSGHLFTRSQGMISVAAPGVLLTGLGLVAAASIGGSLLIIPLAAHLAGCCGDALSFWHIARRRPRRAVTFSV